MAGETVGKAVEGSVEVKKGGVVKEGAQVVPGRVALTMPGLAVGTVVRWEGGLVAVG